MTNIIPLHNEVHKDIKVSTHNDFSRFKAQHLIPVVVQEFSAMATEFPIVFVKNGDTGQFLPVAMMGLTEGVNLYCQQKDFDSAVLPMNFQTAPFSLTKHNQESDEVTICIDSDSNLISAEGNALFDDKGEQTDFLKQRSQFLIDMVSFSQQTMAITQLFNQKELLITQQLTVKLADKPLTINGLYMIDEKKLNELPNEEFNELRNKGLLPLIYAHLTSIHQINRLAHKQAKTSN
ncbi:SapC family protein [Litorilituus lipolyticus]|uniref:Multidrug transporter n=1 Tax=Litorilituus lipolyticus TaxID=2491017 RepID=A0A502LHW7_9GAMM|nr:SapC family protein [Litorilituus lipolyticus]TPH19367.1 multidrug transporter [Litorilituus lipolyticus]